ncbi:N-acetylglucosaminyldiphosphoundecaprenol N-acetyl-beta-D-mannosaminyltransferase [Mucilaginibacter oryzae]|uniref:N-acetylglucosaminyldiphosphoundecaprenol N-acetyl-beta-D-mannosaminyltransferase n=1 Tax=Mucilaginibacter oryzae TaxID=468058 RepID=A0A316HCJ8_9SPHI|nr:WecB/TagA/CpsF family glycosyltransferase [Mucilaginibacter oryzae]PWK77731.1 N-acetylglucosaminyldiphosphoundecaprenol N-acetyl-beta-D-mannosaminyltransferase [Mucilaginibacter oryzae]
MKNEAWKAIIQKVDNFSIRKGLTSFVNPYSMLVLKDFPDIANGIDYWQIDGISLVNEINRYKGAKFGRFSFDDTSVAPVVFNYALENKLKVGIVGTKHEYLTSAVKVIESKYNIKISYYRDGYFSTDQDRADCLKQIIDSQIDIFICGMGTPLQELFLIDLKKIGWSGYAFTCGGYLHQIARKENYYPAIFDKLNIRWIYRIIDEPKLFRRYFIQYPRFFIKFLFFKLRSPNKI